jgi:hypothetical protein
MTINQFFKYFASIAIFMLMLQVHTSAQNQTQLSVNSGYHVINTDEVSNSSRVSRTDWIFGGTLATRFQVNQIPFEYNIGYSSGQSTIYAVIATIGFSPIYSVDLRYRTVPQELLWVNRLTDRIELLAGINVTAQDRTLMYSGITMNDDRLFSMGVGLSGKVHTLLYGFNSGNGGFFFDLAVRWTEFIYHDAKDRNLDDFTLRHVTISPRLGISYMFR